MSVRAVLIDLDDTLTDHSGCSRSGLVAVQAAYPSLQRWDLPDLEQLYRAMLEELHTHVLAGRMTVDEAREERFHRLFTEVGDDAGPGRLREACACYAEAYDAAVQPIPGAADLLSAIRAHAWIAVVTNNLTLMQQEKLVRCGLNTLVDALVTSEDVEAAKPDPAIFRAALAHVLCAPEEAVMFGDAWETDILGARAAGIRAVWFNRAGVPCPDPSLAAEVRSLQPAEDVVRVLLG